MLPILCDFGIVCKMIRISILPAFTMSGDSQVVCQGGQWTHRAINAQANQLAHYLRPWTADTRIHS